MLSEPGLLLSLNFPLNLASHLLTLGSFQQSPWYHLLNHGTPLLSQVNHQKNQGSFLLSLTHTS
jgi:hypothetical protein